MSHLSRFEIVDLVDDTLSPARAAVAEHAAVVPDGLPARCQFLARIGDDIGVGCRRQSIGERRRTR